MLFSPVLATLRALEIKGQLSRYADIRGAIGSSRRETRFGEKLTGTNKYLLTNERAFPRRPLARAFAPSFPTRSRNQQFNTNRCNTSHTRLSGNNRGTIFDHQPGNLDGSLSIFTPVLLVDSTYSNFSRRFPYSNFSRRFSYSIFLVDFETPESRTEV